MDKQRILNEIRRTAEENGGTPRGVARLFKQTGIRETGWRGKFWTRWGNAVREAGCEPNELQIAYDDKVLIEKFISLTRELGRVPVATEIMMKRQSDDTFPGYKAFARAGSKQEFAKKLLAYCEGHSGYEDAIPLFVPIAARLSGSQKRKDTDNGPPKDANAAIKDGYVYLVLLKLGREKRYKIGKAILVERRKDQLSIQLPEDLELIHAITTDDAYGIEDYWHRRFATKNIKGEWFLLSREDVDAFKRQKFM